MMSFDSATRNGETDRDLLNGRDGSLSCFVQR